MNADILVLIGLLVLLVVPPYFQYRWEKRQWNDGTCPKCGTPWRSFDMDSQGGRGYNCETRCSSMWISWLRERELPGRYVKIQKA